MINNNIKKINSFSFAKKIIKGYFVSCIVSMMFLIVYALLLANTNISEGTINISIMIIVGISILIGSSISSISIKKNGIINGLCVGGIYIFSLYIISSIIICNFSFSLSSVIIMIIGTIVGGIGGIIGVNIGK